MSQVCAGTNVTAPFTASTVVFPADKKQFKLAINQLQ